MAAHSRLKINKELREELRSWYGLVLTEEFMDQVMDSDPLAMLLEDGIDTMVREAAAEVVAQKLGLGSWPIGMTSKEEQKEFFSKLPAALEANGQAMEP